MEPRAPQRSFFIPVLLPPDEQARLHIEYIPELGRVARWSAPAADTVRWALAADTHVAASAEGRFSGRAPDFRTARAALDIAAWRPDGVIVNGDVAWSDGRSEDYLRARLQLQPLIGAAPLFAAAGNHDARASMLCCLEGAPRSPEPEKCVSVVDAGPVRFVLLDSLFRTDVVPGFLGQAQRTWLSFYLEEAADKPVVLFVHHPLNDTDGGLLDGDRLLRVLHRFPQVKVVFTAHDHLYGVSERNGLHLVAMPAVAFPFRRQDAIGWLQAEFTAAGIALDFQPISGSASARRELSWLR